MKKGIMRKVMGIIYHNKNEKGLAGLTAYRCMAALPFGGRYRLIDFILSNMVNAGISNVGIVTPANFRSLLSHLGNGKEWGLDKKHEGLFFMPTAAGGDYKNRSLRRVDLEDLYVNSDYIKASKQNYVLLAGCNSIANLDLSGVMALQAEKKADITAFYQKDYRFDSSEAGGDVFFALDKERRVTKVSTRRGEGNGGGGRGREEYGQEEYGQEDSRGKGNGSKVSLGIYLMQKKTLLDILDKCARQKKWDLVRDFLAGQERNIRIYGCEHQGYFSIINSVESFYSRHMGLLEPGVLQELFLKNGYIYTKMKDGPSTKYYEAAEVRNALVSNGCLIQGRVENSIIYRNVKIAHGATVKNSIIMPKVEIGEDAVLNGVILDKYVHVRKGTRLVSVGGEPLIVGKSSVV